MTRREQAMAYFKQGFNCSQSVLRAYSDLFDMPEDELMKAGQSFGGGMGRLRLVCGAVSGICLLYTSQDQGMGKAETGII